MYLTDGFQKFGEVGLRTDVGASENLKINGRWLREALPVGF